MSPQYRFVSLEHPSKFQQVSRLGFLTTPTSLNGGQQYYTLHDVWPSPGLVHYIHFRAILPELCQLQNSLFVQVLCSPILAPLLHGTQAAAVSKTLWRSTRNGITELSQRAPTIFSRTAVMLGISAHIVVIYCNNYTCDIYCLLLRSKLITSKESKVHHINF